MIHGDLKILTKILKDTNPECENPLFFRYAYYAHFRLQTAVVLLTERLEELKQGIQKVQKKEFKIKLKLIM